MDPEERTEVIAVIALLVGVFALGAVAVQTFSLQDKGREVMQLRAAVTEASERISVLEASSAKYERLLTEALNVEAITRQVLEHERTAR